jgi:hypothetical protein
VPQYRGYDYFVVRDEIVIVEPGTKKIVTVIAQNGQAAQAPAARERMKFSSEQREVIRKGARVRTTTGGATRTTVTIGERVPDTIELRSFDEDVYTVVPSVRTYRYIESPNGVYLVDPQQRTVIEEIE